MMQRLKIFSALFLVLALSASCVSKKKLTEMETLKNQIQDLLESEKKTKEELKAQLEEEKRRMKDCDEERKKLKADSLRLAADNADLQKDLSGLKGDCETLKDNYRQLRANSTKQMQKYIDSLEGLSRNLRLLENNLAEREARLAEVEAGIRLRDSVMNALRKRVADALLGFQDQGLTVEVRDGKVYVSLSNKLLFASGSTKIDAKGKEALKELARVLKEQKDLTIMVEGHTDDVKVTNLGDIKDNWDLSVMRSTEVVRVIVTEGVEPTRIVPSGRGEFIPKVAGSTAEARAANRRTEIVISPKLDELYNLINSGK